MRSQLQNFNILFKTIYINTFDNESDPKADKSKKECTCSLSKNNYVDMTHNSIRSILSPINYSKKLEGKTFEN